MNAKNPMALEMQLATNAIRKHLDNDLPISQ
jgi:hypothetical protein